MSSKDLADLTAGQLREAILYIAGKHEASCKLALDALENGERRPSLVMSVNGTEQGFGTSSTDDLTDDPALLAAVNGHEFEKMRHAVEVECAHCEETIGSGVQGYRCRVCGIIVHYDCIPYVARCKFMPARKRSSRRRQGSSRGVTSPTTVIEEAEENEDADSDLAMSTDSKVVDKDDADDDDEDDNNDNVDDGGGYKNMQEEPDVTESEEETSDDDGNWSVENSDSDDDETLDQSTGFSLNGSSSQDNEPASLSPSNGQPKEFQVSPRAFGRTGARADWMDKPQSFRKRLSATRRLDYDHMYRALQATQHLYHEFDQIPENRPPPQSMPRLTDDKNRYHNILPNNHTRVVLSILNEDPTTQYINANFIAGYKEMKPERYIAAQGPMPKTIADFWRMVWESKAHVIVMNTDLVEAGTTKCERYWPEKIGDTSSYGSCTVKLKSESQTCQQFVTSKLVLECDGDSRELTHLWWRAWPDKGVPDTSEGMFPFVTTARALADNLGGPIVVHCSAGVGRTGCFINIDIAMQQWDAEGAVDILGNVCKTRRERGLTVQTAVQYRYIHSVLLDYMKLHPRDDQPASKTGQAPKDSLSILRNTDRMSRRRSKRGSWRQPAAAASTSLAAAASASAPTEEEEEVVEHDFVTKTYVRETYCDVCKELLAGLSQQGMRCRNCKTNIHHYCLSNVDANCQPVSKLDRHRPGSGLPSWPPRYSAKKPMAGIKE